MIEQSLEHRQIKGITVKNLIVTVISTISIVVSVMTTYFGLKGDIADIKGQQETTNRVNEIRIKTLEGRVDILEVEVRGLKDAAIDKVQTVHP